MTRALVLALGLVACGTDTPSLSRQLPLLAVAPAELDFGEVAVPTTVTESVAVANAGRAQLTFEAELRGADAQVFALATTEGTAGADGSVDLEISFSPPTFLAYTAELVITSNDDENPERIVPIRGQGVSAPVPDILLSTTSIDFGQVDGERTEILTVENVGTDDLVLGTVLQVGAPDFELVTDPSGNTLAPGDDVPVVIRYTPPPADTSGDPPGASGELRFPSNDPDEPEVKVVLLANGGADYAYPVAVADCPSVVDPPRWVSLDGRASDAKGRGPLTYAWTLPQRPTDSTGTPVSDGRLESAVLDVARLWADAAGTYVAELVVTNVDGVRSAPARCTLQAIPDEALAVELSWNTPNADVDLHVARDGKALFDEPDDVCWCHKIGAWGTDSSGDFRLDLDDKAGFGPETIAADTPPDGNYTVRVHYFKDQRDAAITATVRVWIDGQLARQFSKVMQNDNVWDVARIDWPARTVAELTEPLQSKPSRRDCF
ncbi:MAG: choice-of-anchor D domain-containing protein [Alphaproteobacteria bacterium]|nr:choice-of-anchor D domain-containing protein [Alphaproteobacteria bacterium]